MQQFPSFYVRFTFADVLFDLCFEFDQLKSKTENTTASILTDVYSRDEHFGSSSINQTEKTAMELLVSVRKVIRDIADQERPLISFDKPTYQSCRRNNCWWYDDTYGLLSNLYHLGHLVFEISYHIHEKGSRAWPEGTTKTHALIPILFWNELLNRHSAHCRHFFAQKRLACNSKRNEVFTLHCKTGIALWATQFEKVCKEQRIWIMC